MIAGSLNVCFGSVAAGGPQRFWAAALRSKPAAQITRLASLPQAEIGQKRTDATQKETRRSGFLMLSC